MTNDDLREASLPATLTVRIPASIHPELTGNSRAHPMMKYRLTQELQVTTGWAFRGTIPPGAVAAFVESVRLPITLDWVVARGKFKKPLDDDNVIHGLKAARDSIAQRLGIDDKHFVTGTVEQIRDPDGIGFIEVRISEATGTGETL